MITEVKIQTTENGYTLTQENEKLGHVNFSFESFEALTGHLVHTLGARVRGMQHRLFPHGVINTCEDQSPEAMRDEIGELRRFKDRAIKRDAELQDRLTKTIDSLNDARSRCDRFAEGTREWMNKCEALEASLKRRLKRKVRK